VHPYLRRHDGLEEAAMPHESMRPALGKTLGVPLFQEQMMQLAIDCAGFAPDEADRLRQAMSAKRAPERIEELRQRLLDGMAERGIGPAVAEDIYAKILAFSNYGFPESHAISFAYLVYASAWLKRYYPAAFTAALLRNQPMGFYAPHSLINDARRHGVTVHGVDVNASDALATLEGSEAPAIRLGLSAVRNLGAPAAERVAAGRPYRDLEDFATRTRLPAAALEALATAGAFGCFGLSRRAALWAAGAAASLREGQLPGTATGLTAPSLPGMTPAEETLADLWATSTYDTHPVAHVRAALDARQVLTAAALKSADDGAYVAVAGLVTHRQRPSTARGVVFLSLEDETGMVNVICLPPVWERHQPAATVAPALVIWGRVERTGGAGGADGAGGVVNLVADTQCPSPGPPGAPSPAVISADHLELAMSGLLRVVAPGAPSRQRTPRGRNCTLIRGPTGWDVFGTACSQVRWQLPPMTSRSPCPTSNRSGREPPSRGRSRSGRGVPSDKIATMVSSRLPRPIVSPCQATLSRPSRYRHSPAVRNGSPSSGS
jgi:error-prone DNA polymerase